MATEPNGRPLESSRLKGKPNGSPIGRDVSGTKSPLPASLAVRTVSLVTRLLVWYTILTALLRCPSSFDGLTNKSPRVCKPYLNVRSHVAPYVEPYYKKYAAPHVERARPYASKLHEQAYVPAVTVGKQYYEAYGAPRLEQARTFGQDKWEKTLKPQVDTAQLEAKKRYDSKVAPHVDKASAAAAPYVTASRQNAYQVYNKHILPTYGSLYPYIERLYSYGHLVVIETGLPYAQSAWSSTIVFMDRTLWPKLRILYGENVEPQLVRIGERLGRYRDGKKVQAVMDDIDRSSSASASSTSSMSSSAVSTPSTTETATSTSSLTPEQETEQTRIKIESDLGNWQDKFSKAADKGMEDLQERVKEITERQIESQVGGTGRALVIQLEETVSSEETKLKKKISAIVKSLPKDASEETISEADENLSKATRVAGLAVKDKAQALRSWKESFSRETHSLISAASKSTLEVIDNIRDLGLQEIGMKWAHMDGVTYKDWSKYHDVKKSFDEWHQKVDAVAQSHPGLRKSDDASEDVEAKGMSIAGQAAKELSRLKDVGKWKIHAKDESDDFSTQYIPAAAAAGAQKIMEKVSKAKEQVVASSQSTVESIASQATRQAVDAASDVSSKAFGTEPGRVEQAASKILVVPSEVRQAVVGTPLPKSENIMSAARDKANQAISDASEAIIGAPSPVHEAIASQASKKAISIATGISEAVAESSNTGHSAASIASSVSSSASSIASKASEKVYGGAMAQEVKGQKPIMDDIIDDDATYSEKLQSMVDKAGESYADITKAVSEAMLGPTKSQGTVESASSVADEQYTKALAAASSVLYGTKKGTAQSATSVASEKWNEAVAAASSIIYGTPAPVTQSAASAASVAYADATSRAQEHYSHALSIVSAQVSGKSEPFHKEMFASVESAYSDSLAAASGRLQSAVNAASTGIYGNSHQQMVAAANAKYSAAVAAASSQLDSAKTAVGATSTPGYEKLMSDASSRFSSLVGAASAQQASATKAASGAIYGPSTGVLESISALASSRLADSLSAASAQFDDAKTAIGAKPTPMHQQYLKEGQRRYYEAVGLAHERYSEFVGAAKGAVYGTPTPVHKSIASVASEQIYGSPTPIYQSMLDQAQVQYSQAVAQASENLQAILGSASSAVGKTSKSPAQSILDSASSQYSSALSEASVSLSSVSVAASSKVYGTSTGKVESIASVASQRASSISSAASTAVMGSETPWSESVASQASENWEALVSKASEQVYGAHTPFHKSVYSQAGGYAAQASDAAGAQYEAIQALFSELVSGREPDFTESVMNRLSSAYYTGAHASVAASASVYARDAYASVSSAVSGVFTPPASLEAIIAAANEQVNAAVEAASKQAYGTEKGTYEKGTSAAASAASSASSRVSEALYGSQPGYVESAQKSMNEIAASASEAIAAAIYGTTATGTTASITSAAGQAYDSVSSVVSDKVEQGREAVEATRQKIREAVYGPEKGAMESAQAKLMEAVESAKARMVAMADKAGASVDQIQNAMGNAAGSVSSVVAKATDKSKDEL